MTRRTWFALIGTLATIITASLASCQSKFDGPYACAAGFASCVTPTGCETLTSSDGANCGACGNACSPGAACMNGTCGAAPAVFETTPGPGFVQIAGNTVAWATGLNSNTSSVGIDAVSRAGGTPTALVAAGAVTSCNAGPPFAIDGAHVYYFASGSVVSQPLAGGSGSGSGSSGGPDAGGAACATLEPCCGALGGGATSCAEVVQQNNEGSCQAALSGLQAQGQCLPGSGKPGGAQTDIGSNPGGGSCDGLVLSDGTLYFADLSSCSNCENSSTLFGLSASAMAGTPASLASVQNWGGGSFVVSGSSVYFSACAPGNGPCGGLGIVPVTGGAVTYGPTPNGSGTEGGQGLVAADASNVYAVTSGWNCDDNNGSNGPDAGMSTPAVLTGGTTLYAFPLNGGPPVELAATGDGSPVSGVAVDSTNVYWAAGTIVWSVPVGGGTPTPIAGNLGTPVVPCTTSSSQGNNVSIASDGKHVYVADAAHNAIYRLPVPQ